MVMEDAARSLLESLEPPDSRLARKEWRAEIERRARAAMEGSPGVLWEDARDEISHPPGRG